MTKVIKDMTLKVDAREAKAYAEVFAAAIRCSCELTAMQAHNAEVYRTGVGNLFAADSFRNLPACFGINPEQIAQIFTTARTGKKP